ncbi:MAG TPA: hypothetical protein DD789_09755 [Firmicutes bacterium]|nr:hypothetical protein [Bacillota bacterium]
MINKKSASADPSLSFIDKKYDGKPQARTGKSDPDDHQYEIFKNGKIALTVLLAKFYCRSVYYYLRRTLHDRSGRIAVFYPFL